MLDTHKIICNLGMCLILGFLLWSAIPMFEDYILEQKKVAQCYAGIERMRQFV